MLMTYNKNVRKQIEKKKIIFSGIFKAYMPWVKIVFIVTMFASWLYSDSSYM